MTRPADDLPPSLAPCGLSRVQSAAYVGVGPSQFLTDYLREADAEDDAE